MSRSTVPASLSRPVRGIAAVGVALAFLTACGGDPDTEAGDTSAAPTTESAPMSESEAPAGDTPSGETQMISVTEEDFSIALEEGSLAAGTYEIEVANEGSASHDLVVERDGEDVEATEIIAPDGSATVTVTLEPGEYVFYCSVGNHRGMGMETPVSVS